jgi:release factor glutamine methyltransferase
MEDIKITTLIRDIEDSLRPIIEDDTMREQYAWWTLESITGLEKISLITRKTIRLTSQQKNTLAVWIDKMVNEHMPIAYLIGSVPFADLDIIVQPPVLIPRPETEEWVINLITDIKKTGAQHITILDMCSGSGCIALAFAKAFPDSMVYAIDISDNAIALGKRNAAHNNIHNVRFIQSNLFNELDTQTLFDIIVSNPPYISFAEFQEIDASVSTWEDTRALVATDNGTAVINDIISRAADYIKPHDALQKHTIPQLVVEIGYNQGPIVKNLMQSAGLSHVKVHKDLEEKDRVVMARVGSENETFQKTAQ